MIAVDVMSGEKPPEQIIRGALRTVDDFNIKVAIVGDEELISSCLKRYQYKNHKNVEVYQASDIIGMHEKPSIACKRKKDASIKIGFWIAFIVFAILFIFIKTQGSDVINNLYANQNIGLLNFITFTTTLLSSLRYLSNNLNSFSISRLWSCIDREVSQYNTIFLGISLFSVIILPFGLG